MHYATRQRLSKGDDMINTTDKRLDYVVSYDNSNGMYKFTVYDKSGTEKHFYHIAAACSVFVAMRQYAPLKTWQWRKTGEAIQ